MDVMFPYVVPLNLSCYQVQGSRGRTNDVASICNEGSNRTKNITSPEVQRRKYRAIRRPSEMY
jgi:hypothetical protein